MPVGTLAIGEAGAINAALLAAAVLALSDDELAERLEAYRARADRRRAAVSRSDDASRRPLPPGSVIGILGGGQLGRMLALAAARLGHARPTSSAPIPKAPPST